MRMNLRNSVVTIVTTLFLEVGCGSSSKTPDASVSAPDAAADVALPAPDGSAPSSDGSAPSSDGGLVTDLTTCSFVKDRSKPVTVSSDRQVLCALDLGSNTVKLVVMSIIKGGKVDSLKDERQCRNQLKLGTKVFDSATGKASPLPDADQANLVAVIKDYQKQCTFDGGTMVGAEATQWARDATNIGAVVAAVNAQTGLMIDVLSPVLEGTYGYSAATYNTPQKISIDPGSNSFQLAFWTMGDSGPKAISVPLGYTRAANKYFANTADATITSYAVARMKYLDEVKTSVEAELGKLTPPLTTAGLKAAIAGGKIGPELYLLGQDGAVALGISGALKPGGAWITDKATYDSTVATTVPAPNPMYLGQISAVVMPSALAAFPATIMADDFTKLRTSPVRDLYGDKLLTNAALIDYLVSTLGLSNAVLVPQELPAGYILAKMAAAMAAAKPM
jgi:hypothetical protein